MTTPYTAFKTQLDAVLPTLATKADIDSLRRDIKRWTIESVLAVALVTTIASALMVVAVISQLP